MKEKFVAQRDDQLICRHSNYGPVFGGGADICIIDGCNIKNNSYARFPKTYNRAGGSKLEQNKDTYLMFSGVDNHRFKVVEYEVFHLV